MSSTTPRSALPAWIPYAVLGTAVLVVSSAAILIRVAQAEGVPSISIAAWRLTLAALLLWPLAWQRNYHEIRGMSKGQWALGIAAGGFLALHFASWISSLAYTSVASSTALVTTNPVWIALVSWLVLGERPSRWLVAGIAFAIGGSTLIFASDATATTAGSQPMLGNLLAVIGSMTVCGYLLIGRTLRRGMHLLPYIWLVYSAAAIVLLAAALAAGAPLGGYSMLAWACLAGLALGPQLLGHTAFNWALRHVSATFIAVTILGEPIGSALLAWLVFGEGFAALQLAGFSLLMVGIYLASRGERSQATP